MTLVYVENKAEQRMTLPAGTELMWCKEAVYFKTEIPDGEPVWHFIFHKQILALLDE